MKLQIIQLESEDDHITVRDKLATTQAPRVLLVWPFRGRILTRKLDIKLIERAAKQRGIQLGFVAFDPDVLLHSNSLGVPVFESLDAVPESDWPVRDSSFPDRRQRYSISERDRLEHRMGIPAKPLHPAVRISSFALAMLSILAVAVIVAPHAEVALLPKMEKQTIEIAMSLNPDIDTVAGSNQIPARLIQVEVMGQHRLATSGTTSIPAIRAMGEILITNLTSEQMTIPSGTGVRSAAQPNLRFSTTENTLLAAEDEALVLIIAMDPGREGNLPADSIDTVDGVLGLSIRVTNPNPTTGGASQFRSAVTQQDIENVERELTQILLGQARDQMALQLAHAEQLAVGSLIVRQVLESDFDANHGEPTETLGFSAALLVTGLAYEVADVEILASSALADALPRGQAARPGTLGIESISDLADTETPMLSVAASQSIYGILDPEALKNKVRGMSLAEAEQILIDNFSLAAPPTITASPSWFGRIPWLSIRIDVRWVWEALS